MSSMDDFKNFINHVGTDIEQVVLGPSQMMNKIVSTLSSPVIMPILLIGGGIIVLKFLETKR